ncbi:Hypothetical protein NTJ_12054 [Nesidiocoris tenuis]|uniref:Uncharacterized protein n=1 Tax=Nesidiocoris tenuis TaxID=355587 RepID=A0ABN7B4A7_9HEMI|nr:Hypothetical protein NTJ_12054 [Nesidiocoris tenuis]
MVWRRMATIGLAGAKRGERADEKNAKRKAYVVACFTSSWSALARAWAIPESLEDSPHLFSGQAMTCCPDRWSSCGSSPIVLRRYCLVTINTPRTPREREYSRTPPLGRSEAPIERGRVSAESQTPPVPTSVSAPGGGSVVGSLSLAPAPCCSAPRRVLPTAPAPVSLTPQHHHHQLPQHSSNIW